MPLPIPAIPLSDTMVLLMLTMADDKGMVAVTMPSSGSGARSSTFTRTVFAAFSTAAMPLPLLLPLLSGRRRGSMTTWATGSAGV
jgi:hypothetical protein